MKGHRSPSLLSPDSRRGRGCRSIRGAAQVELAPGRCAVSLDHREPQLVRQAQQGDERAFEELFEAYKSRAFRVALSVLHNHEEAEDATAEAFLRAWLSVDSLQGECSFWGWLQTITVNHCLNLRRRRARRAQTVTVTDRLGEGEEMDAVINALFGEDSSPQPDEALLRQEEVRAVRAALRALPERWRNVLGAFYLAEMTETEVAEHLQLPLGTVRRLKHEGKEKLRALLQAQPSFAVAAVECRDDEARGKQSPPNVPAGGDEPAK